MTVAYRQANTLTLPLGEECDNCGRPAREHDLARTTDRLGRSVCRYRCPKGSGE